MNGLGSRMPIPPPKNYGGKRDRRNMEYISRHWLADSDSRNVSANDNARMSLAA